MADQLAHEIRLAALDDEARSEAVARQHARGKWTARERIAALLDDGSFCELGALALPDQEGAGEPLLGDGIITGTGTIGGRQVVVIATDFMTAGGSNGLIGNEKQRRCWEIGATRGIPVVMLLDGGGHRIHEGLDARTFAGGFDIQQAQARLSGWVPMVAVIAGAAYGQPTIAASLCDYVVAIRGIAQVGMAPPALVRAATGETVDSETLNGADAQAAFGAIDLAVDSEEEALDAVCAYLALLPDNAEDQLPRGTSVEPDPLAEQAVDVIVPPNLRVGYDMSAVLRGIVDDDSIVEIKAGYALNMITTLARIEGHVLGIIANQPAVKAGMLDAAAAEKAAHFTSLCDAFGIPILVIIDLPGLVVGQEAESTGLARRSARMSAELAAATVPTFTVVARKGYGGGYVLMSGGRTFHPEVVLAWPHAETAVMAVETAVDLVYRREVEAAGDPAVRRDELVSEFRSQLGAIRAAEGFGVDAIIRPSQTRQWIGQLLPHLPRRRLMQQLTPRHHGVAPM